MTNDLIKAWYTNPANLAAIAQSEITITETTNSAVLMNNVAKGAIFYLNISAVSGESPTLDIRVQAYDPGSDTYLDIDDLYFARKTAPGSDVIRIYPGMPDKGGPPTERHIIPSILPRQYRFVYTVGGVSPSFTFTIGVNYIR